jgi:DinB family protein
MKTVLVAFILLGASSAIGPSQAAAQASPAAGGASSQSVGPVKEPVSTSLRTILPNRQKNILGAIEAMPADKFGYKPTPDQMSFGHLVVHITESNNAQCARIADIAPPKVEELRETDSKDKLLAAARASFDFCASSLANVDDSKMGEVIEIGHMQAPRVMSAFFLTGGWADHYGAAAMYLRLNGILPPSAQPKK